MIKVDELTPLVEKVSVLKDRKRAEDIFAYVMNGCEGVDSPSMAQSVCEHVISMCHPRAWGDRDVEGFYGLTEWTVYLAELGQVAKECWNNISENNGAKKL